jgi:hypothetical protein
LHPIKQHWLERDGVRVQYVDQQHQHADERMPLGVFGSVAGWPPSGAAPSFPTNPNQSDDDDPDYFVEQPHRGRRPR